MKIPIARTNLTAEEIASALGPLESGWLVQGPNVMEFEAKWSSFTGSKHSVAVTSCTTGLHLALAALKIGPGDEVIVPAFTWISTANVVEHVGAKVVFCDINPRTFNLDIEDAASKVTDRTRAIMPVHLFGLAADIEEVIALAREHSLYVIEDAACGFGSTYKGKHVGTFGDAGVFSFHPRKAITTGEGGMVTTQIDSLAASFRRMRDHGAEISDLQRHLGPKPFLLPDFPDAGFNYRMTDFQGALGSAQMNRADEIVSQRRQLASVYDAAFSVLDWLETPYSSPIHGHSYQSYACLFRPDDVRSAIQNRDFSALRKINLKRDAWMEALSEAGISTRPATHAVHMLKYYREKYGQAPESLIGAYAAYLCSISLPLFHGMTRDEQAYVVSLVQSSAFE